MFGTPLPQSEPVEVLAGEIAVSCTFCNAAGQPGAQSIGVLAMKGVDRPMEGYRIRAPNTVTDSTLAASAATQT